MPSTTAHYGAQNPVALPYIDLAAAPRLDRGSTLRRSQVFLQRPENFWPIVRKKKMKYGVDPGKGKKLWSPDDLDPDHYYTCCGGVAASSRIEHCLNNFACTLWRNEKVR